MEKIEKLTSTDIVAENIKKLKQLFPTIFKEGKIDKEELQAVLGDYVEKDKEYYQMTWAGKTQAQREANRPSSGTLRPCQAESKDWDSTQNLFIEGDNLEVLKLLQKTYNNKVKMIYIDPPYNTGQDFVYKDNYKDNLQNYFELTGQTDEEGKKLSTNTETAGRYHSNWLNMMYPRLKLARNLLTEDGVIFISIDDNEQANLKKLCDEIFGEENFVNGFIWVNNLTGRQLSGSGAAGTREYILVYSKNVANVPEFLTSYDYLKKLMPDTYKSAVKNVHKDDKGEYVIGDELKNNNSAFNEITRPNLVFDIYYREEDGDIKIEPVTDKDVHPKYTKIVPHPNANGVNKYHAYRWSKEKILKEKDDLEFVKYGNTYKIFPKRRNFKTSTVKDLITNITTSAGSRDMKRLDIVGFNFPKPVDLIMFLIEIGTSLNDIILDFFSGSCTTAHTVMQLNAEDGGNRKCISVQLPEPTDEKSAAYKAGYKTIAEIGKERIRRAGEKIKEEHKDKEGIDKLDIGFRVFKLDTSNIVAWDTATENLEDQLQLFAENNAEHIKQGRSAEDILYEILLKFGLDLSVPIQEKELAGHQVYNIGHGAMYVCLDDNINGKVAQAIGEWHKDFEDDNPTVIFKDTGFAQDQDKTNTIQMLKQFGIDNVKSI